MLIKRITSIFIFILCCASLFSQTHASVPLDNQVYYILEQAELRGLCSPMSGVRPYTRDSVIKKIQEILSSPNAEKLKDSERDVLEKYIDSFSKPETGLDLLNGSFFAQTHITQSNIPLSLAVGVTIDAEVSSGIYPSEENYIGFELWPSVYVAGDLGNHVSYDISVGGGIVRAPRRFLGTYNTYYEGFVDHDKPEYENQIIDIYSEPLTHFPYTYKKRWDSSVFFFSDLTMYDSWPNETAGGYYLPAELTASFLENKLITRAGRISREWGSTPFGSSLAFNNMARPFFGVEVEFFPVSWFGIASLTGTLEYHNIEDIKVSSRTFQNLFSATIFQFRFKNYVFFDFIDAVVYPKRIELGYISPIINSFFYQNNVGDFDNMAMTANLRLQYPGLGSVWFSFFMDEMNLTTNFAELDRQMVAAQAGINIPLPFLSFTTLKASYTKVNPYCYTHNRNYNPWYGNLQMETAYVNNGVSLGYYLPPNSDEILVNFKTMPVKHVVFNLQYQLIRHGADFGSSAVDGSHLRSELAPDGRDDNPISKRFFLQDGAYRWSHIVRAGFEWPPPSLPVAFFGEAGLNYSYFTNIGERANVTGSPHRYSVVDTPEYPKSTAFILRLGIRIFPRR